MERARRKRKSKYGLIVVVLGPRGPGASLLGLLGHGPARGPRGRRGLLNINRKKRKRETKQNNNKGNKKKSVKSDTGNDNQSIVKGHEMAVGSEVGGGKKKVWCTCSRGSA